MVPPDQGLLLAGVAIPAVAAGFLLATVFFVVQLRNARNRIAELESGELRHVEPGVVRMDWSAQLAGASRVEPRTARPRPELVDRPGWTAIVVRGQDSGPQTPPETVFVPTGLVGHSGGLFATEEARESFRRNHLTRFDALHDRLGELRTQLRAELTGCPDPTGLIHLPTPVGSD